MNCLYFIESSFEALYGRIATFLHQKNLPHTDHFDLQWLAYLYLLTDIIAHMNALNVKLQNKDIHLTDMHAYINAFNI